MTNQPAPAMKLGSGYRNILYGRRRPGWRRGRTLSARICASPWTSTITTVSSWISTSSDVSCPMTQPAAVTTPMVSRPPVGNSSRANGLRDLRAHVGARVVAQVGVLPGGEAAGEADPEAAAGDIERVSREGEHLSSVEVGVRGE